MATTEFRALRADDFPQLYHSFTEAFSEYSVNMKMSKSLFRSRILDKLNIRYDSSPGIFVGDKLVAFIFHTLNEYEGQQTAYNGGTGVIPGYWGHGFTQKMYDFIEPSLIANGVQRCLLEVITTNEKAIKAYKKSGFRESKYYKCFKLTADLNPISRPKNLVLKESLLANWTEYQKLQSVEASMLDCDVQLAGNIGNEKIIEAFLQGQLVGYIIMQHRIGRISQLAVRKEFRRQGIGTALLRYATAQSKAPHLTVVNINEDHSDIVNFLSAIGFENQLDQFEMELSLRSH